MRKILVAVGVVAALVVARPAEAQFQLDLKLAYAVPSGDLVSGARMSDGFAGALPIGIDALYRFTPNLAAGVYFQYAPAFFKSDCNGCTGYDMRVGLEVAYAFLPDGGFNPWVSLGTGWQWTRLSGSDNSGNAGMTFSGWEYFNIQAGVDFPVAKAFAIGPYLGFFGGTYTTVSASGTINDPIFGPVSFSGSETIPSGSRTFHGWWQFGLKGTLNL